MEVRCLPIRVFQTLTRTRARPSQSNLLIKTPFTSDRNESRPMHTRNIQNTQHISLVLPLALARPAATLEQALMSADESPLSRAPAYLAPPRN